MKRHPRFGQVDSPDPVIGNQTPRNSNSFVSPPSRKRIGKPVKLLVSRIGLESDFSTTWQDVKPGKHVLGCRTAKGVYAVVEEGVRVV